jgi:transposase
MSRRRKYTDELKLEIVQGYLSQKYSFKNISDQYRICKGDVQKWVATYREHGIEGLTKVHGTYSGDFKLAVVEYMYNEGCSARKAAAHFNIASHPTVSKWERIYLEEGPVALYVERRGRGDNMKKGRPPKLKLEKKTEEDLIAEVQRLRMENEYLKKLNALV